MNKDALETLTLEQLKEYQKREYSLAQAKGVMADLVKLARVLGKQICSTYTKYQWENNELGIKVFYDQYGGYMTVSYNGKQVCSTHTCSPFFVSGEWQEKLSPFIQKAKEIEAQRVNNSKENQRQKLIAMLATD